MSSTPLITSIPSGNRSSLVYKEYSKELDNFTDVCNFELRRLTWLANAYDKWNKSIVLAIFDQIRKVGEFRKVPFIYLIGSLSFYSEVYRQVLSSHIASILLYTFKHVGPGRRKILLSIIDRWSKDKLFSRAILNDVRREFFRISYIIPLEKSISENQEANRSPIKKKRSNSVFLIKSNPASSERPGSSKKHCPKRAYETDGDNNLSGYTCHSLLKPKMIDHKFKRKPKVLEPQDDFEETFGSTSGIALKPVIEECTSFNPRPDFKRKTKDSIDSESHNTPRNKRVKK